MLRHYGANWEYACVEESRGRLSLTPARRRPRPRPPRRTPQDLGSHPASLRRPSFQVRTS